MWELVICLATAWGHCYDRPPIYFASRDFCERALAEEKKRPEVRAIYCRPKS